MKVLNLTLENFKRFKEKTLDFRDPETGLAKDLIVLVGQNGSGKSSTLQAIAASLRWTPLSRHKMVKNKVELSPL